jgi:hypothetical protein
MRRIKFSSERRFEFAAFGLVMTTITLALLVWWMASSL